MKNLFGAFRVVLIAGALIVGTMQLTAAVITPGDESPTGTSCTKTYGYYGWLGHKCKVDSETYTHTESD